MKALYLLSSDGSFRRATSSQIAEVLGGGLASTIARLKISDDGEATPVALGPAELDELREGLNERRDVELWLGLDRLLESRRRLDNITGVSLFGTGIVIYLEEAPWAEAVVRKWAGDNGLHLRDENPPTTGTHWTRTAYVNLGPEAWSSTLVTMTWPRVNLVAQDATIDDRTEDAERINAEAF
jgi:hypothetical protein